ncbi:heterokaryon incompatibility protein-domain-containing protein [Podospora australis]|uniref:Heterokaryon incompatibility protein-domain-containing protein n=1 Tax=Podospora australis TaxID=1536484 RepID=A0AAN7AF51_9PEZI|nr:heterokaryon incompatibility protein-domain-containing protein [Podospora australis]
MTAWQDENAMSLGDPLSSLVLSPCCPLCRLIYRIFPRDEELVALDPNDRWTRLVPFRGYVRHGGWDALKYEAAKEWTILLGVQSRYDRFDIALDLKPELGGSSSRRAEMEGECIALKVLAGEDFQGPRAYNARLVEPMVDFNLARKAVDWCIDNHPGCRTTKPDVLRTTTMLDVFARKRVPCPENCEYVALSYVWGNVMPEEGALEKGTLPQTLEDAITVTREMGWRYVWIDALCIDQTPNPTEEQKALKFEQLQMMDLIYECAVVVLVAVTGKDSAAGLTGVSRPRPPQLQERYDDNHSLFTAPPEPRPQILDSIWMTRAWTFQEGNLGRRYLYFAANQLQFRCLEHEISDAHDAESFLSPAMTKTEEGPSVWSRLTHSSYSNSASTSSTKDETTNAFIFTMHLAEYTSRRMTNESDSLYAFLGMISAFEKRFFPGGFTWGLPLRDFPRSLGWFHDKSVGKAPKRRSAFPTWSWCGWEGAAVHPEKLIEHPHQQNSEGDMIPEMLEVKGRKLRLSGWLVTIEVKTNPFAEVYLNSGESLGFLKDRNFPPHINTIGPGTYTCFVLERLREKRDGEWRKNQTVFLLVLDYRGEAADLAERRTMLTFTCEGDFSRLKPKKSVVTLV